MKATITHELERPRVVEFVKFINERHSVYLKRAAGKPKPWTADPMLQSYRFTNVYRELDAVTQWIAHHWRSPHYNDLHLWFLMVVARLVNVPDTLRAIMPAVINTKRRPVRVHWDADLFVDAMHARKFAGHKVFGSAYIVSTNGHTMDKAEYLAAKVLTPMWADRAKLLPQVGEQLATFHTRLCTHNGMGSFMAGQVVADMKYAPPLKDAPDWATWAASGPGSRRGLNMVLGRDPNAPWREPDWLSTLQALRGPVNLQRARGMDAIHAQDLQNCLCEYSKYIRGYSRQKFQGT